MSIPDFPSSVSVTRETLTQGGLGDPQVQLGVPQT